jgi:putative DNA primase/helicase
LSKLAPVIYQETAKSELWEKFIAEIMDGDKEKIRYLQRVCGLALTADTSLECLWVLYGASTRNGKSTFCEVISTMLGDYAAATPPETFSQKKRNSSQASGDIARLDNIRFLTASEFPQNMLLDVALVKTLTGRDKIVAL